MSHVISNLDRPSLVLCPTKTLAAQLCRELRSFLPNNSVELFVSYYNYYTPESFHEASGKYTAKKSSINAEIDSLRHRATRALFTRDDVVVVASVSCIYGLGLPAQYLESAAWLEAGDGGDVHTLRETLEKMLYRRPENNYDLRRGDFLINYSKNTVRLWPPYEAAPLEVVFGDRPLAHPLDAPATGNSTGNSTSVITRIIKNAAAVPSLGGPSKRALEESDVLQIAHESLPTQLPPENVSSYHVYPARHFVTPAERVEESCDSITAELEEHTQAMALSGQDSSIIDRLKTRVSNDVLALRESGSCSGVENYSRYLSGREPGAPPDTLLDYFTAGKENKDWLLVVDESHVTLPQLKAMSGGDRARKNSLVKNGYRLPSALDNRPLNADEFWERIHQCMFVSATPGKEELLKSEGRAVDMFIRPTNIVDPAVAVRPSKTQLKDVEEEIKKRAGKGEKTLVMALTKRDAEDMADHLKGQGVKADYIHSGLSTIERSDALKSLQNSTIDCLVGVNLMREGIDLPQVSLVAILRADCEGFLRGDTALMQMIGRAARNVNGEAILYADRVTGATESSSV